MRTLSLFLLTGFLSCWISMISAQSPVINAENFDGSMISFTSSPATAWRIDTNYNVSSPNSIRGIVPNKKGDTAEFVSQVYDFSNYSNVLLRFNHICKISPQDIARIEYRRNMGGGVMGDWIVLPAASYLGNAKRNQLGMYEFNASAYTEWMAGDSLALPAQSWWKEEMFDVSFETSTSDAVQFRFLLIHGAVSGTQISYGWLIDSLEIITASYELTPPLAAFIDPLFNGSVNRTGPYEINAKIKSRTSAQIENPELVYITANNGVSDTNTVSMTAVGGDSLWKALIPQLVAGTEVDYSITATDRNGNTMFITSSYVITIPSHSYGDTSAALTGITSPMQGQTLGNTTVPVEVVLHNMGDSTLTSATINWTVNGVLQTPHTWTGSLSWDFEQKITIGTYSSRMDQYDTIVVWVSMPNGVQDIYTNDDKQEITILAYSGIQSGTYTIGQGELITTLAEAFTVLRFNPPDKDITFAFKSGVYATNWDFSNLPNLMGNYNLTITSLDRDRDSVTLRPASGVGILLNNSNNIRIEDITIDVSTSGTYGIQFAGACTNVVINRCNILGRLTGTSVTTNAYAPVYKATAVTGLVNISITNCTMRGGYSGVYLYSSATTKSLNIRVDNNIFSDQYHSGVYFNYADLNSCSYNQVSPRSSSQGTTWYGLYLYHLHNGGKIIGNRVKANNTGISSYLYGIYTQYVDSALVANNEVILTSKSSTTYGMYMANVNTVDYLHNSVLVTGTGGATFRAVYISGSTSTSSNVTYKNNIFVNNGSGGTPYAVYLTETPDANFPQYFDINYNNYYSSGNLALTGAIPRNTLSAWKATVPTDINSINKLPDFIDAANSLELRDYASLYSNLIPTVSRDIHDSVRRTPTAMGCYEDVLENVNASLVEILGVQEGMMAGKTDTVKVVFTNNGITPLNSANLGWSINGTEKTKAYTFNPPLASLQSDTVVLEIHTYTAGNLNVKVWINSLDGGLLSDEYLLNDTVSTSVWICGDSLSGIINIPSDFTTVTEAIKVVAICGTGDITLVLDSGEYVETCDFTQINRYKPGNTLTLTSKTGKAEDVVIKPASRTGIILDNTRNLVLKAITVDVSSGTNAGIQFLGACTNIVVRDCRLLSSITTTTSSMTNAPVSKAAETGMVDSIFFINNLLDGGYIGFCLHGGIRQALNAYGTHIVFDSNIVSNQFYAATYIYYSDLISCSGNTVLSRTANTGNTWYGIYIRESNAPVIGNRVRQRSNAITIPYGISCYQHNLMYANPTLQNRTLIANNEVIVNTTGVYYGIHSYRSRADILHNSVYVTGNTGTASGIYAVRSTDDPSEVTAIKNNNVVMTSPLAYPVSLISGLTNYDVDYNNLYAPTYVGYEAMNTISGSGEAISSMETWQKHTGFDQHSVRILPDYIDIIQNLKLSNYTSFYCNLMSDVVTDIEGSTRMTATTMGCYEQEVKTANGALVKILGLQDGKLEGNKDSIYAIILNAGTTSIDSVNVGWSINGTSQGNKTITYSSALTAGQQDAIFLGELTYAPATNEITIWINNLNGGALQDDFLMDDTIKASAVACPNTQGNIITVSKTGSYKSITQVIDLLSACGLSSDMTVVLETGVYEENVNITNMNMTGNYSLTLTSMTGKPEDVIIRPAFGTGIVLFNSNNIKIRNITVDIPQGIHGIELASNCSNIIIDSCIIFVDSTINNENYACIYKKGGVLNGLTIKHSIIHGGYHGIYLEATSSNYYQNVTGDSNVITAQNRYPVYFRYINLNSLSYNQVTASFSDLGSIEWWGLYITNTTNGKIVGNRLRSDNSKLTNLLYGIYIYTLTNTLVANNEVYLNSSATTTYGMHLYYSTRVNYLHNTVLLTGTGGSTFKAGHIYMSASYSGTYKNNIFVNNGSGGTPCAISSSTNSFSATILQNNQIDYNNYYSSGNLGYTSTTPRADYAAWKSVVTTDVNSTTVNVFPLFTDLTKDLSLSNYAGLSCPFFPNVPQDINNNSRVRITTKGAHGDGIPDFDLGIEQIIVNTAVSYPQDAPVKIKIVNVGSGVAINNATFGWSLNGEKQTSQTWTAASTPLQIGDDIEISIGSFNIAQTHVFDITVWIENVNNGMIDSAQWNDTASISVNVFWAGHNLDILSVEQLVASWDLCPNDYVPLKIKIENTGALDYDFSVDTVTFSIRVSNPEPYRLDTVFSAGKIKSGETVTLTLTEEFPIVRAGEYDIEVFLNSPVESINSDDTARGNYVSGKFKLPIDDNFDSSISNAFISEGNTSHKWEFISKGTGSDSVVVPQFGAGMIAFKGSLGSVTTLLTQRLDLSQTEKPSLSFWYFHDTVPCEDYTDVRITVDGGTTYNTLFSLTKYNTTYGWKQYSEDLPSYAVNECVRLVFEAMEKSRSEDVTQYIDRIRITAKQDIAVTDILISEYSVCDLENKEVKIVLTNLTDPVLNYDDTLIIVTLEVKETGQIFTDTLRGSSLEKDDSDTITLATDFDLEKGTYTFKAYFSSILDVDRNNDTLVKSVSINPKMSVYIHPESMPNRCLMGEFVINPTVTIYNEGNMDLSNIELIFQIDTGDIIIDSYTLIKEICKNTLLVGDTFTYTFTDSYIVPWKADYHSRITAYLQCDSALIDTVNTLGECVDTKDLYIVRIDNPTTGQDRVGDIIQVRTTLQNRSDLDPFNSGVNITVFVTNSQGTQTDKFTERTGVIGTLATVSYDFTQSYTVPKDSVYYLTVYLESNDIYLQNDTHSIKRSTDYTDINVIEKAGFALGQNTPNPANKSTHIDYCVPEAGEVVFHVHSISGQLLYSKTIEAERGVHRLELNTSTLAAGIYFYSMEYKGQRLIKRMSVK
ncbi:MAG: right-handed parallel beta-helix repeat-containing protein [Bacteroidales bacterium]|jgi:hypothetical protein|nr:right-handed parallel beta-helix repeat-containing protein [Bacteroidales bacterium]